MDERPATKRKEPSSPQERAAPTSSPRKKQAVDKDMGPTSLIWFRKGLRLHDNPALVEAIRGARHVIPVMVIDPALAHPGKCGARPLQFFLECVQDLERSLQARQSRLVILHGDPAELIPRYVKKWGVSKLCFEEDTGRYSQARDAAVRDSIASSVAVHSFSTHTLYKSADVRKVYAPNGYPQKYESFLNRVRSLEIDDPLPDAGLPETFPPVPEDAIAESQSIPTIQSLGFDCQLDPIPLVGGETSALERMEKALEDEKWVRDFQKPQTSPLAIAPASTTCLSPYLARGCLSVRLLYSKIETILAKGTHSKPPVSLKGQLLWREFYYAASYLTPNYYEMEGNPVCRQIPWSRDAEKLEAWTNAQTGYPWIDAAMTQLRQEGWIHHLARHAVACFLTRGDLWVDWRLGRDVFDKMLLDTDPALNNGNWQWLSASAYFHQYFRVYGPVSFAKKYDSSGAYIRHYLPVLRKMPDKFVYEPWKAPKAVQSAAGCVLGKDYPKRIVVHEVVSKELTERMAAVYKTSK
ncbi:(6-4)DNA photolyase [Aphanomyces cochlioides]|nr:(6-4)DNA photolyase [Aphanomyces cochlioides]